MRNSAGVLVSGNRALAGTDGKMLFTANGPSDDVSVIDLATKTVVKVKVGYEARGAVTLAQ